jgi:uncharacterized membrane protein
MARKPVKRARRTPRTPLVQRLRGNFLTGLVVVLPAFLTLYLLWVTISFVDARVTPLIPARYNPEDIFGRSIFGLGLLVFLAFTTLVGALTKGFIGRRVIHYGELVVERMPVVRSIYNALKQVMETVLSPSAGSFKQVCLIEYPHKGMWSLAFVSTEARGEVAERLEEVADDTILSVLMPTTPNPTNGFLFYVPRRDVILLDMSIEDAAKLIISAGLVQRPPPAPPPSAPSRRPAKLAT